MDVLRAILGDKQLNFLGYSYGTWLGARYASLFPDQVNRMVLIGLMDVTKPFETTVFRTPLARQRLLDEWLIPYANRHPAAFELGETHEATQSILNQLDTRVQHILAGHLAREGYRRVDANNYLLGINAAKGLQEFIAGAAKPFDRAAAVSAFQNRTFVSADVTQDRIARGLAKQFHEAFANTWEWPDARGKSVSLDARTAVYWAVRCNDSATINDIDEWHRITRNAWQAYPLFAGLFAPSVCVSWGGPSVETPSLAKINSSNVLLVQSHFDAATAVENAEAALAALPHAHLLTVPHDFDYGVYPYMDNCVDETVVAFLLGEKPVSRKTTCRAHPLPWDARPAASGHGAMAYAAGVDDVVGMSQPLPQGHPMRAYKDPAMASALIQRFKEGLVMPLDAQSVRATFTDDR
jgi:pimeloyl-ACP methyl ester carboxylesterase